MCGVYNLASDWELVRELVEFLKSLTEEEFLAIMYGGEWFFICVHVYVRVVPMLTAKYKSIKNN